jgi:hypothetical protein
MGGGSEVEGLLRDVDADESRAPREGGAQARQAPSRRGRAEPVTPEQLELVEGNLDLSDALDALAEFLVERWLERHARGP